jgi:uncharacterized protein YjiS (DUF1127 family)
MKQNIDMSLEYDTTSLSLISFLEDLWEQLRKTVAIWKRRKTTRARLAELSTQQLNDIGIDQRQAFVESSKRFWEE